jgi:ribosome modulation factor
MDEINTASEAYQTGVEAKAQGENRADCPYDPQTWEADNWLAGYDSDR